MLCAEIPEHSVNKDDIYTIRNFINLVIRKNANNEQNLSNCFNFFIGWNH